LILLDSGVKINKICYCSWLPLQQLLPVIRQASGKREKENSFAKSTNDIKSKHKIQWQAAREAYAYQCWSPVTIKINSY